MTAQVISGANNGFCVAADGKLFQCVIKGKRFAEDGGQKFYNPVAPGDFVEIDETAARIVRVLPRKTALLRKNPKSPFPQVIAANIDCAAVFTTPDSPPFRPRFVDRVLWQCDFLEIPAFVVVNKTDLEIDAQTRARIEVWRKIGVEVVEISAKTLDGVDALKSRISQKTCAFVGQSGVGKSSAVNILADAAQKVGAISEKYERGNHTTTCGKLFAWSGGKIIDTPGIRSFLPFGATRENAARHFREIAQFAQECEFGASCMHSASEKGCAVQAAVASGGIDADRFESYESLLSSAEK